MNRGGPYGGPDATAAAVWRHAVAQRIAQVTVVVREYDEAIRFYTETLGFRLLEDTDLGGGKRWVRVAPAGAAGVSP